MAGLREKLQSLPPSVTIPTLALIIVGLVWLGVYRARPAGNYEQPPVELRCSACGYTEHLSVEDYAARMEEELPGGAALLEGPALKCPKCGRKTLLAGGPGVESSPDQATGSSP